MNYSDVAGMLGVSKASVYSWASGVMRPTRKHLEAIAQLLELDINDPRVNGGKA